MSHKLILIVCLILPAAVFSGTIVGSKHDLSSSGYEASARGTFNIGGPVSDEVCVFCHTPHGSNNDLNNDGVDDANTKAPLWNRRITNTGVYQVYTSPTMNAACAATPSPVSLACLSCHDGFTAGGIAGEISASIPDDGHNVVNPSNRATGTYSGVNCFACHTTDLSRPQPWFRIGANLSDDHPVSINYQSSFTADGQLNPAPDWNYGWSDVKLYNGRVECPSCHNVHDPTKVPFLRRTMEGSNLCLVCHNK